MAIPAEESRALEQVSQNAAELTAQYLKDTSNRAARLKARTAAKNLLIELQDGDDAFFYRMEQMASATVLRFLLAIGAVEAVPLSGSISAVDLASTLRCEQTFIVRLMRIVVATGVFAEVSQDTYAHTKHSVNLLDPGYSYFYELMMDDFYAGGCFPGLGEYFAGHEKKSPNDPKHNVYSYTQGMDGRDWHEVIARTPEKLRRFNVAFTGRWATVPVFGMYPFAKAAAMTDDAEKTDRVLMVDVGGAIGGSMKEIREACPDLSGKMMIVQDQEKVIKGIPEGFLPPDIVPMAYDFWTPQPVKGAKFYYLRRVLHDWPDTYCAKILQNQADAMAEDSILLIADMVVPDKVQRDDTYVYWMDLTMFMFAGKERSAADWRKLFEGSGLELVKIWEAAMGTQCVIEGRKKRA